MDPKRDALEIEILERCLRRLEQGADLETLLREVPEAVPLRPLLETALWLRRGQEVALSPAARRRLIRQGQLRAARRAAAPRASRPVFRWAWALVAVLGLILVLLSAVGAAEASLPGEPLYPVKRAVEGLVTLGMSPEERALYLAERRWSEFEASAARGRWLPDLAEESLARLEEAARLGAEGPAGPAARLRALYERQGVLLEEAAAVAPPDVRSALARARQRWAGLAPVLGRPEGGIPEPTRSVETPVLPEPTAEILRERIHTPPGLEKQETPSAPRTPPGQEKKETPRPVRTPPGQEKKDTPGPPRGQDSAPPGDQGPKGSPGR
ncbi:MAG: hypothetical protein KNN16_11265 [Thermoflexus hugenholtzii]|jgi:hypothetical protein|uniref:hypothetical protein n=1 Tax=Thermoflexus TaxID=1495649 RepID=UPI001C76F68A|nr:MULTISPECIES: hypothetical protein [Thermoflexus]QWK09941.1 MAG: hypothetical protein KNN16_11265 [Thermoflexus hugenholtzii]